jgi:hypothetical protein
MKDMSTCEVTNTVPIEKLIDTYRTYMPIKFPLLCFSGVDNLPACFDRDEF